MKPSVWTVLGCGCAIGLAAVVALVGPRAARETSSGPAEAASSAPRADEHGQRMLLANGAERGAWILLETGHAWLAGALCRVGLAMIEQEKAARAGGELGRDAGTLEARLWVWLGTALEAGRLEASVESREAYERARRLAAKRGGDDEGEALRALAEVAVAEASDEPQTAIRLYVASLPGLEKAARLSEQAGSLAAIGRYAGERAGTGYLRLAELYASWARDGERALRAAQRAFPLCYRARHHSFRADDLLARWNLTVGSLYLTELDDPDEAEDYLAAAISAGSSEGNDPVRAQEIRAEAHEGLAELQVRTSGDFVEARRRLEKAIALYQRLPRTARTVKGLMDCRRALGEALAALDEPEQALASLDRALEEYRGASVEQQDPTAAAWCWLARGMVCRDPMERPEEALHDFEKAAALAARAAHGWRAREALRVAALAESRLGESYWLQDEAAKCEEHLRRGIRLAESIASAGEEDKLLSAALYHSLAEAERARDTEPRQTLDHYRRALALHEAALQAAGGDRLELGTCAVDLATQYAEMPEQMDEARRYCEAAIAELSVAAQEDGEALLPLAAAHGRMAGLLLGRRGSHPGNVLDHLRRGEAAAVRAAVLEQDGALCALGDLLSSEATCESELFGDVAGAIARLARAASYYAKSAAGDEADYDPAAEWQCRVLLAGLRWHKEGDRAAALRELDEARQRLASEVDTSPSGLCTVAEFSIAEAMLCAEDEQTLDRAEEALLTAAKSYEEARRGGAAVAEALEVLTFNIAMFYETAMGDGQKALEWYGKNVALQGELPIGETAKNANRALAEAQMGLVAAELLRDLDQAQQHAAAAQEALGQVDEAELANDDLLARVHLTVGALESRLPDGAEAATQEFLAAIKALERVGDESPRARNFEYAAHRALAEQLESLGKKPEAAVHLKKSVELARELGLPDLAGDEERLERTAGQPKAGTMRR